MLEVRELVTAYAGVRALDGVSLSVPRGSITAVLGANGAGKTTLLRTITGLVRPRAGTVALDGRRLTGLLPEQVVRTGVALVPEGRGVITELSVEDNLRLGGLWRRNRAQLRSGLADTYAMFPPLAARRRQPAGTLSGGERQMLALGRALLSRPSTLLLDEPSLGLAPRAAAQIMAVLRRLRDETGLTVLLVEQNSRSALSIADAGVVLDLGRVVASGPAAGLAADVRLRQAYLGFG